MLGVTGGIFTPAGLAGSGGPAAITRLITRLEAVGITFRVDEERAIVPRGGEGGEGDEGGGGAAAAVRRPAWQSALNAVALVGWCIALAMVLAQWPHVSAAPSTPLMRLTMCIEMICVFEVCQIAIGAARGNLILGFVLHYTRVVIALVVFPIVPTPFAPRLVLLAWSRMVLVLAHGGLFWLKRRAKAAWALQCSCEAPFEAPPKASNSTLHCI